MLSVACKISKCFLSIDIRTIYTFSSCNDLCLMDADGETIISGHLDNNIRLWDTRTGASIKELTGVHNGQVTSVSMSPGKRNLRLCLFVILIN